MKYISTSNPDEKVSFKEAVILGLAKNKALFVPEYIPILTSNFFDNISCFSKEEIAYQVMQPFVKEDISEVDLMKIVTETINFDIPIKHIENNIYVLELFHGPTQAFKDVGARFLSRCMSLFAHKDKKITILVATSGDTGSAVANGFFNVPNTDVVILFPKGKVSAYQEFQMTSLGNNIKTIAIDGTFDDCQNLVKQAFSDEELNQKLNLSSANSINVARLLPQMIYYFLAYQQLKKLNLSNFIISIPSGNLGNLTAGVISKQMGLPITRFICAENKNDTFVNYLHTGNYIPKSTQLTYSNAMDVGDPSNFVRLLHIYKNYQNMIQDISGISFSDSETILMLKKCYQTNNYILDPHGALGKLSLDKLLKTNEIGVFLETAAPKKFENVVQKAIPNFPNNEVDLTNCYKTEMSNNYLDFKNFLVKINNLLLQ
jgi:threonine synthase